MEFRDAADGLMEQMRRLERGVWWMTRQAMAAVLARADLGSVSAWSRCRWRASPAASTAPGQVRRPRRPGLG
ncbi:MAG: hypothetical protein JO153_13425 [Solirubrobacterales bacterium]|nr:hypothetical protein [Solirubrobacterales bacterium]